MANAQRLAKYISRCGYCSRREAEKLIEQGEVMLNGVLTRDIISFVQDTDIVEVKGIKLSQEEPKIWKYYKPRGLITTHKDPQNRSTVFDNIKLKSPHIISVGRLDIESEGLLLLTNSGFLARKLELPENNFSRKYHVKVFGKYTDSDIQKLRQGPLIDGVKYKPCRIELIKSGKVNNWFELELFEGKNREIRNFFKHINLKISRLIRISYGPISLGDMKTNELRRIDDLDHFIATLE
ncbi:MAG: pseudouridine synthase [Rickettsiaceae bacterium]|nr:pseudouridine synthase [Rickettsiaceae bacterium]